MAASLATPLLRALEALAERHVDLAGPAAGGLPSEAGDETRRERGAPPPLGGPQRADRHLAALHEAGPRAPQTPGTHHHDAAADHGRARPEPPAVGGRAPPKSSREARASPRRRGR